MGAALFLSVLPIVPSKRFVGMPRARRSIIEDHHFAAPSGIRRRIVRRHSHSQHNADDNDALCSTTPETAEISSGAGFSDDPRFCRWRLWAALFLGSPVSRRPIDSENAARSARSVAGRGSGRIRYSCYHRKRPCSSTCRRCASEAAGVETIVWLADSAWRKGGSTGRRSRGPRGFRSTERSCDRGAAEHSAMPGGRRGLGR